MKNSSSSKTRTEFFEYFKKLTPEQIAEIAEQMPVCNPDGHVLTDKNIAFLQFQNTKSISFTVVAGYKQWQRYGRNVRKGSHGFFIFIPAMIKSKSPETGEINEELDRFLMARVFDISQTADVTDHVEVEELSMAEERRVDYDEDEEGPDCKNCGPHCDLWHECNQDPDLGGTGHGDISWSDADPGL